MSEDKLTREALEAYEAAQKESDRAAHKATEHDSEEDSTASPQEEGAGLGPAHSRENPRANATKDTTPAEDLDGAKTETASSETGADLAGELAAAQEKRITELDEELARARADLYNLQQEYNNYVRRTKAEVPLQQEAGVASVVNALMSVLDDIALARTHGDLGSGPFKAVAQKLESALEAKFKVKRFGQAGEDFDPQLHQAIQMLGEGEGHQVIEQVAQPGYLMGETVLRPAMVVVAVKASKSDTE